MPNAVSAKLKELAAARARLASLEQAMQAELRKELAGLPAKYGFDSVDAFVDAVRGTGTGGGRRRGRPAKAAAAGASSGGRKRRRRAVITDATRAEVKKLVSSGKTGAQIAESLGISLPSVQNIKKALGLVKKR
jgi:DNA-binding NarL/FixJ family response regulator